MKALLIAVTVAWMATACTDSTQPIPELQPTANDTVVHQGQPILYLDVPVMNRSMYARPHKVYNLVEFHMGNNVVVGKTWIFSNDDTSLTATICWYAEQDSIVLFNGNIGNTTYAVNTDRSTMSICHGPQETPISFKLITNNSVKLPTP